MSFHFFFFVCVSLDIDECVTGENLCPYNRQCVNTFGSYFCKCQEGYDLKYVEGKYDCVGKLVQLDTEAPTHAVTATPHTYATLLLFACCRPRRVYDRHAQVQPPRGLPEHTGVLQVQVQVRIQRERL